ncbi:hypothetical protein BJ166DRAFT_248503 [Pestalotiopsis sp. NC0098]|nr:hypothetical protein BJ166DRAFT_248503 [Pestalotiopsis sp. NC0098]
MSLTSRITTVTASTDPLDLLGESLGVIFPDDVVASHGDATDALRYTSPHLPKPLHIRLADPDSEEQRLLFSHHLWNASLLMAEFVEAGSLGLKLEKPLGCGGGDDDGQVLKPGRLSEASFDAHGLSTIELGSGTALPSIMGALLGAARVVATDYPAPPIMEILRTNVAHNTQAGFAPAGKTAPAAEEVAVEGHAWGETSSEAFAAANRGRFDRVVACDCFWMPWQHDNLRRSIAWFLRDDDETARAWLVAGFHTGRHNMVGFFDQGKLAAAGLELESIWERDVEGQERDWATERRDDGDKKRWLAVATLRKARRPQS